jgi:MFS transporter, DHA2 family, multidrug resistance protein
MTSVAAPASASDERIDLGNLLTFICLVFGMFMAILDIQIVSASMADIRAGLSASKDEVTWVQTSYLIAEVIMIPLTGFFSRALGTRYLFALSAAGFTFASLMCGLATSINDMIFWRAAQGFLGGAMVPTVFAMSWVLFPRSKQRIISPMIALILTTAPTIGPSVGGYVTEMLSWRWLFFINVVPGIIITIVALLRINFDKPDFALLRKLDWAGMIAMAISLGSLEYLLEEGPRQGWFDDTEVLVSAVVSAVAALIFVWRIRVAREPIVDFRAFTHRNFALGAMFSFVVGMGLFGLTFLFPIYLGQVRGHSAVTIGETLFVTGAAMFVIAPINSRLIAHMDPRLMMAMGLASFGIGTWLMTGLTRDWDFWELMVPQLFRGAGLMMAMLPINNMSMGTLPPELLKGGAALYNLVRILGGAVGVAALTSVLNARTDLHLARLHERATWTHGPLTETLAELTRRYASYGSDAQAIALKTLNEIVHRQGLVMAFADVFWMLTVVFGVLAAATFLMKRPVIPGVTP